MLTVFALVVSVGAVASAIPGLWRVRLIRLHGLQLLVIALGPPLVASISSIVVAIGMGRRPEGRRGRRLAVTAIVLSLLNIMGIIAVPVMLALSFGMGRTMTAEERRSDVASVFNHFSVNLGSEDMVLHGTLDGGRDGSRWYLISVKDMQGLKKHLLAVPRQVGKVSGGQTFIHEDPPRWWKIKASKVDSVEIDTGRHIFCFFFSYETGDVYLYDHKTY